MFEQTAFVLGIGAATILTACTPSNSSAPLPDTESTFETSTPGTSLLNPPNCPFMIEARSFKYETKRAEREKLSLDPYLSFELVYNPNFKPDERDDCAGDLKNLWPDLLRFETEIAAHWPNIREIDGLGQGLKFSPETFNETKRFIDQAATAANVREQVDAIDRSTLEGGLSVNKILIGLVRDSERRYWMEEQGAIIEAVLSKYSVKVTSYAAEKTSYCYHPYSICRSYYVPDAQTAKDQYELEYLGSPLGWLGFSVEGR